MAHVVTTASAAVITAITGTAVGVQAAASTSAAATGDAATAGPRSSGRICIDRGGESGADRRSRCEDEVVAVAPDNRRTQGAQHAPGGPVEVEPPEAEYQQESAAGQHEQVDVDAVALVGRGLHRDRRGQHRLTEHDHGEQPAPLGDVLRVKGCHLRSFRPDRNQQLRDRYG